MPFLRFTISDSVPLPLILRLLVFYDSKKNKELSNKKSSDF